MGFQLNVVFSGPVEPDLKKEILAGAVEQWPFIRTPAREGRYLEHPHFAPPELTEYLYDEQEDYERAVEQSREVEESLPTWGAAFATSFAFLEIDCFGGTCLYSGYACRGGEVLLRQEWDSSGHRNLLKAVGIVLKNGQFAPFERGYFGGVNSGRKRS